MHPQLSSSPSRQSAGAASSAYRVWALRLCSVSLFPVVVRIHLFESVPSIGKIALGIDRLHRTCGYSRAAINTLHWIDIEHRVRSKIGLVPLGMNADRKSTRLNSS